ncbi:MAG TPA: urease accessory UreF family protein [Humisphaera sp.]|nr:urease accessory UreF family protein [Humisphaera sp.]
MQLSQMMQNSTREWLIYQLTDSSFPTGGFAHSAGLEAAWQIGAISAGQSFEDYLATQLRQFSRFVLPFVIAANRSPDRIVEFDSVCGAMLSNHVARRASIAQGQAFALAASRTFQLEAMPELSRQIKDRKLEGHFAPLFGASCAALGLSETEAARVVLFTSLRGLISAAVRLGIVGPLEAQAIQWRLSADAESCVADALKISLDDAAQTAPLLDLFQGMQDRLYSRLFQS